MIECVHFLGSRQMYKKAYALGLTLSVDYSLAILLQVVILLSTGGANGGGYMPSKYIVLGFYGGSFFFMLLVGSQILQLLLLMECYWSLCIHDSCTSCFSNNLECRICFPTLQQTQYIQYPQQSLHGLLMSQYSLCWIYLC